MLSQVFAWEGIQLLTPKIKGVGEEVPLGSPICLFCPEANYSLFLALEVDRVFAKLCSKETGTGHSGFIWHTIQFGSDEFPECRLLSSLLLFLAFDPACLQHERANIDVDGFVLWVQRQVWLRPSLQKRWQKTDS